MDVKQLDAYCAYVRRTAEADAKQLRAAADRQIALLEATTAARIERVQAMKELFEAGVKVELPKEIQDFLAAQEQAAEANPTSRGGP